MTKAIAEKIEELADKACAMTEHISGIPFVSPVYKAKYIEGASAHSDLVKAELEAVLKDVYGARDTIHGEYCYDHPIEECGSLEESIRVLKGLIDE